MERYKQITGSKNNGEKILLVNFKFIAGFWRVSKSQSVRVRKKIGNQSKAGGARELQAPGHSARFGSPWTRSFARKKNIQGPTAAVQWPVAVHAMIRAAVFSRVGMKLKPANREEAYGDPTPHTPKREFSRSKVKRCQKSIVYFDRLASR